MKSKGIKNLLIDLGGVLINLDRERCIENFKKIGFQNIEEKFCTHQLDGIFLQQEKGLITPAEFRDGIREMMGKMVSDKQIDAAWNSFLVDIPTYKLAKSKKRARAECVLVRHLCPCFYSLYPLYISQ